MSAARLPDQVKIVMRFGSLAEPGGNDRVVFESTEIRSLSGELISEHITLETPGPMGLYGDDLRLWA